MTDRDAIEAAQTGRTAPAAAAVDPADDVSFATLFEVRDVDFYYGNVQALRGVSMDIHEHEVTAFIGPSGCGKTTLLRCFNRMNDLIPATRLTGSITYHGEDVYRPTLAAIELRRRIGMVFQGPNPFPRSIYDNIAFAPRANGVKKGDLDGLVETSLRRAALWDEVKGKLKKSAFSLSGGQQQRLCIARAIAVEPEVILMDEPCSALDPIATARVEELMLELRSEYTIVIVTHNLGQALRTADRTAFLTAELTPDGRTGVLVEMSETSALFTRPSDPRTADYISGKTG